MRDKTDSVLGRKVQKHLQTLGLETLVQEPNYNAALLHLEEGIGGFLGLMGLDVAEDLSIKDTPRRVAEMFTFELCQGLDYSSFPKCTATPNGTPEYSKEDYEFFITERTRAWEGKKTRLEIETSEPIKEWLRLNTSSKGRVDEMVMLDSITTTSLCEHHFQTITGLTHIAYIPGPKILGVSKFARVTNFFGRRPQIQERMTEQIYAALAFILETEDVAVQQVCAHHCIRSRGAMDPHSMMTTSKLGGRFKSNPALRAEFLHGIK